MRVYSIKLIKVNIPGYKEKLYFGISKIAFKAPYGKHKRSFTKECYKNNPELSKENFKVYTG